MPLRHITSPHNPRVKRVRHLHRRRERYRQRAFLAEGPRLVLDALDAGVPPHEIFLSETWANAPAHEAIRLGWERAGHSLNVLPDTLFATLSDLETPPGILAILPMPDPPPPPDPQDPHPLLILDALRDPGNLGTLLRTAAAAGVAQVIVLPGSVDPFSPKVVRAGMGAHWRLPLAQVSDWEVVDERLGSRELWGASARGRLRYDQVDWRQPVALVLGGEATGLGPEAQARLRDTLFIPMARQMESLNVAVAGAIILFEAARQRGFPVE